MGTACQPQSVASYEARPLHPHHPHHHHASLSEYASAMAQADRQRTALSDAQAALNSYRSNPAQSHAQVTQIQSLNRNVLAPSAPSQASQPASRHSTRPSTPNSSHTMASSVAGGTSRRDSAMVMHSLEIPKCISPAGGNLAEFAARLTCLFWFESSQVHQAAERVESIPPLKRIPRLHTNAIPQTNFTRWAQSLLSTTQVTQNVILLALLFIYRLKITNPQVKGRAGSEYRLLTVALMLGNKFLDDNTYTNKTWAEVSGISVKEIHVMEVEFLSNMRYSLLVTEAGWGEWLVKLAKFCEYYERATTAPTSPLVMPSPNHRNFASPLPSPTTTLQLTPGIQAAPPAAAAATYSPCPTLQAANGQPWLNPCHGQSAIPSVAALSDIKNGFGKRPQLDEDSVEPPAKRSSRHPQSLPPLSSQPLTQGQATSASASVPEPLRLPAPQLTLNTAPHTQPPANPMTYPTAPYAPPTQSALSLPPMVPGAKAMSIVYAPPTTTFAPQLPMLTTSGPALAPSSTAVSGGVTTPTGYATGPAGYGTPTKRHSPNNGLAPASAAYASSPLTEGFPHMSGVHTPISHSPSVYLQHRASPYKPVRNFNTLLYPPPSASLQEYHLSGTVVTPSQMHYQPLGRRNEFRTGIVPEFQGMPYGGAVRHGLSLTPVQTMQGPRPHGTAPDLHTPYHN